MDNNLILLFFLKIIEDEFGYSGFCSQNIKYETYNSYG